MSESTIFKVEKTVGVSPWVLPLQHGLQEKSASPGLKRECQDVTFELVETPDSLWVIARWHGGGRVALRVAYCPDGILRISKIEEKGEEIEIQATAAIGDIRVRLAFPAASLPMIRYTCTLTAAQPLLFPFWPRDVVPLDQEGNPQGAEGVIHTAQVGPRTGLVYFSLTKPQSGTVLYVQNLTALAAYCQETHTSSAGVVGGKWPELGLALPAAKEKALPPGREVTISDAFVIFSPEVPEDDITMARLFTDLLAEIYLRLPRPGTEYRDWPSILGKCLQDLVNSPKCWSEVNGQRYLNAYVGDFKTPPESMVQLSVLLPIVEYQEWSGKDIPIVDGLKAVLPNFYDERIHSITRWLPAAQDQLEGDEPQKKASVMDSWYLHHPLLNLSRLAKKGDETAKRLFLDSIDYVIKVAQHFDYRWPIFYDLYTLETIKAESAPGEGGEMDVAGSYAHVMMQAWDLTKDKRYLDEAEKAAKSLQRLGFNMLYQTNSTLFASGAMFRLWRETRNELYLGLAYLCIANSFNQLWLWDCDYGYGKDYPTFFALFPLKGAPYTAVYEELEGYAALEDFLGLAADAGEEVPRSISLLIAEFARYILNKTAVYFPSMLPAELLTDQPRTGELDKKLWIPIEDMHDGWEKAGQVGQEVYGAGLAFGLLVRQYRKIPGDPFMIFVNYPITNYQAKEGGPVTFRVHGDERLQWMLRLLPVDEKAIPAVSVQTEHGGQTQEWEGKPTKEGHVEYTLPGNQIVTIRW